MVTTSSYQDLVEAWKSLRGVIPSFRLRETACVGAARTLLVAELGAVGLPVVTMNAGTHGDERAAPWALFSIVRDGLLDERFAYRIWPCVNPTGYIAGMRVNAEGNDINRSFAGAGGTPEARAIITANRDRRFVLSLDFHEDYEAIGFYCYEPKTQMPNALGPTVLQAIIEAGLPLQELVNYNLGYLPEAYEHLELEPGYVRYDPERDAAQLVGTPYSVRMAKRAAQRVLTFESPSTQPWEDRIAMHRTAAVAALSALP